MIIIIIIKRAELCHNINNPAKLFQRVNGPTSERRKTFYITLRYYKSFTCSLGLYLPSTTKTLLLHPRLSPQICATLALFWRFFFFASWNIPFSHHIKKTSLWKNIYVFISCWVDSKIKGKHYHFWHVKIFKTAEVFNIFLQYCNDIAIITEVMDFEKHKIKKMAPVFYLRFFIFWSSSHFVFFAIPKILTVCFIILKSSFVYKTIMINCLFRSINCKKIPVTIYMVEFWNISNNWNCKKLKMMRCRKIKSLEE